jgi:hypothetical protein
MKTSVYILLFLILFVSCSSEPDGVMDKDEMAALRELKVPVSEYVTWLETNGTQLRSEQTIGDLTYRVTRLPSDMLALREAGSDASAEELAEAKSHYTGLIYFRLEIIANGHNGELLKKDLVSPQQYDERVRYASFGVQKDVSIKVGDDSLVCAMAQFERSFDVAPKATFLIAFDTDENQADSSAVTILFNDQLFNNGLIRFTWNPGEINAYPSMEGTK